MADRDVELNLTARDRGASDAVEDLADAVDRLPDQASVDVEADTRTAERRIDTFDRQVENLTDDARELRIQFRSEQLQREIRGVLRDLERLEDPTEIEARTGDLERAQAELRDLAELADRKYEIQIDADPRRTAQRAAGDLDTMRARGEGLQSALPAIRGFGDELGGTAAGAGIASQAVADLGDFALITGERFATEGGRMSRVATRLGTVLGAAGLAGAVAGIAVQIGQLALPKLREWIGGAEDTVEANEELRGSFESVGEAIAAGDYREAVDKFLSSNDELVDSARRVGVSSEDLARYVLRLQSDLGDTSGLDTQSEAYRQLEADAKLARDQVVREAADRLQFDRLAIDLGDELLRKRVEQLTEEGRYAEALELAASALEDQTDATDDAADAADDQAEAAEAAADALREQAEAAEAVANVNRSVADTTLRVEERTDAYAEALERATADVADAEQGTREYRAAQRDATDAAVDMADAVVEQARAAAEARGETYSASAATSAWNRSMVGAARQASGPLRDAIVNYIATVNGIPPEFVTAIVADTNYASVEEAGRALDDVSRTRNAQLDAETDTTQAERALNDAARDRTVRLRATATLDGGFRLPGGQIIYGGGPLGPPVPDLGDPLPPTATPLGTDPGARLFAADELTAGPRRVRGGGDTYNLTVNLPRAAEAREVTRVLSRWRRVNGRGT